MYVMSTSVPYFRPVAIGCALPDAALVSAEIYVQFVAHYQLGFASVVFRQNRHLPDTALLDDYARLNPQTIDNGYNLPYQLEYTPKPHSEHTRLLFQPEYDDFRQ